MVTVEDPLLVRSPLRVGNTYHFPGTPNGFTVTSVAFDGHPDHDGLAAGVGVTWHNRRLGSASCFYPFASEEAFWNSILFSAAVDPLPVQQV
jgi:hypothetical protein